MISSKRNTFLYSYLSIDDLSTSGCGYQKKNIVGKSCSTACEAEVQSAEQILNSESWIDVSCGGKAGKQKKKSAHAHSEMQWQSMEMKDIGLRFLAIN